MKSPPPRPNMARRSTYTELAKAGDGEPIAITTHTDGSKDASRLMSSQLDQKPHPVVEWKDWVYPHLEGLDDEGALVHDEGRYIVTDMGATWDLLDAKIKYRNGAGVFSFTDADGKFRYIPKNAQIFQQASTQQTPLRIYNQHTNDACSSSNVFFSVLRTRR